MFGSYHALNNLDVFQVAYKHFLTYLRSSRKENYMNASAHRRTVCPKKMIKRRTLKGIPINYRSNLSRKLFKSLCDH